MKTAWPRRYYTPVLLFASSLLANILAFTTWYAVVHYHEARQAARQHQMIYVAALAEHANRTLGEATLSLDQVNDAIKQAGGYTPVNVRESSEWTVCPKTRS